MESLLSQAHLCPLPLTSKPVFWELDHTLRLFPLPHLVRQSHCSRMSYYNDIDDSHPSAQLVLADHADQFHHLSNACNVVNPGRFLQHTELLLLFILHSLLYPTLPYLSLKGHLQATSRLLCTHRRIGMSNSAEYLKLLAH